jgi:hypothetical protein
LDSNWISHHLGYLDFAQRSDLEFRKGEFIDQIGSLDSTFLAIIKGIRALLSQRSKIVSLPSCPCRTMALTRGVNAPPFTTSHSSVWFGRAYSFLFGRTAYDNQIVKPRKHSSTNQAVHKSPNQPHNASERTYVVAAIEVDPVFLDTGLGDNT